jgi:phage antirepressor YoqD-like protein
MKIHGTPATPQAVHGVDRETLLTFADAAARLKMTVPELQRFVKVCALCQIKRGGAYMLPESELVQLERSLKQ